MEIERAIPSQSCPVYLYLFSSLLKKKKKKKIKWDKVGRVLKIPITILSKLKIFNIFQNFLIFKILNFIKNKYNF